MLPKVGSEVQLTKEYINYDVSKVSLKDKKLNVLKVDLIAITPDNKEYDVWFSDGNNIGGVDVDDAGYSLKFHDKRVLVFQPWGGGYSSSKQKVSEDDRCKQCGTMGENRGMSCVCPKCGQVIWGI